MLTLQAKGVERIATGIAFLDLTTLMVCDTDNLHFSAEFHGGL